MDIDHLGFRCRQEVGRCTEIFQRHMAAFKANPGSNRLVAEQLLAQIVGNYRAQLNSIQKAYDAEMDIALAEILAKGTTPDVKVIASQSDD